MKVMALTSVPPDMYNAQRFAIEQAQDVIYSEAIDGGLNGECAPPRSPPHYLGLTCFVYRDQKRRVDVSDPFVKTLAYCIT